MIISQPVRAGRFNAFWKCIENSEVISLVFTASNRDIQFISGCSLNVSWIVVVDFCWKYFTTSVQQFSESGRLEWSFVSSSQQLLSWQEIPSQHACSTPANATLQICDTWVMPIALVSTIKMSEYIVRFLRNCICIKNLLKIPSSAKLPTFTWRKHELIHLDSQQNHKFATLNLILILFHWFLIRYDYLWVQSVLSGQEKF